MAVQFELYKTPMPKEKKNKTRYHAKGEKSEIQIVPSGPDYAGVDG